ncbi:zinc finger CCCH domain-containing protein 33-like [Lolium perenne]|uniref:zinc finger CCCH domain-containing protein 33-like n=1 Tax=Lolium perenne TaxID=4522 RepID=UPI0021EAEB4E|nr:zinc finger CCCH domain-containing protein 33-like [Lolium perenne]
MCPGLRTATAAMAPSSRQEQQQPSSYLLELAADDDLQGFRRAVQDDNLSLVASSSWYGPSPRANNALALHLRTPAMVAALYGSTHVLSYVLSIAPSEAARASATDGATPLLLANAGRAPSAPAAARLLLAAGASPSPSTLLPHHRPTSPPKQPSSPERKKKDYSSSTTTNPATPTEDINAGVFATDEFRMYSFKVNPCSRAYTHDWTECPFAHPGENARRRDPRRRNYTCVPCPDFRRDPAACRKGDACEFAHGVFESWLHPAQYRTRLCKDEVGCPRRICFFAHGARQLRAVNPSAASMSSESANFSSDKSAFSSSPPPPAPSRRPALTASLSARDLDYDADHYATTTRRMMMARATSPPGYSPDLDFDTTTSRRMMAARANSPPGYSPDLVAAYAQALSSLQHQQQQARNSKPLNSRAAAFANRSQTFVHRSPAPAPSPAPRSFASPSSVLDNWGSPDGKLDWGVQAQAPAAELRKSTSFGVGGRPHASVRRDQDMYSWLNDGGGDVLAAARWSDLEQMVA